MKVSRIVKVRSAGRDYIRLYGYDENGVPVKQLKQYSNFVYVDTTKADKVPVGYKVDRRKTYKPYDSNLTGVSLHKIDLGSRRFNIPTQLKDISYQSDIGVELKYILDNNLEFSRKRHIAFIDIETYFDVDDSEGNVPETPRLPITSITMYSNVLDKYLVFTWHPGIEVPLEEVAEVREQGKNIIYICHDEAVMLRMFTDLIKDSHVDIITGWYSHGYDIPYIIKRCDIVLNDKHALSPVGNVWIGDKRPMEEYYHIRIAGLDTIDLMQSVQKMNENLQNNKLDTAAEVILGAKYKKLTTATWRDWMEDFEGFLKYAIRDVEILHLIDDKLKIFEYLIQMQILSSITYLNDIMSVTRLIDTILIKWNWNKVVFPNMSKKDRVGYKGAIVLDPLEPGVHENVAICDYASLYPTTAIAYNISPETFLMSEKMLGEKEFNAELKQLKSSGLKYIDTGYDEDLYGDRYIFLTQTEHLGVIPAMLKELYELRREYKKMAKKAETADERLVYDKKQYAIKIILNSTYGALGFPVFRIYTPECADAITFWGRMALMKGMDYLKDYATVLYGDTDSIFLEPDDMDLLRKQIDLFNKTILPEFIRSYNPYVDDSFIFYELELQRILSHIYFSDAKKRYYSIQDNGKKYIHGLNIIKKDTPAYIKQLLDDLCEKAVRGEFSVKLLENTYEAIKSANFEQIAVHKAVRKKFSSYVKTMPQHVAGAMFANEILGLQLKNSDVVYLFYINNYCQPERKPQDRNNVICLRKEDFSVINTTDKFSIDYSELMEKQFIQPMREFNYIPEVSIAISEWCARFNDNYRTKKDGTYSFKKIKF